MSIQQEITGLQEFFLIHSFLYYELVEAYISDKEFEMKCRELIALQEQYPNLGKYWSLTKDLTATFSAEVMGISGMDMYPPVIRMKAYYNLFLNETIAYDRINPDGWYPFSFRQFCERRGYM